MRVTRFFEAPLAPRVRPALFLRTGPARLRCPSHCFARWNSKGRLQARGCIFTQSHIHYETQPVSCEPPVFLKHRWPPGCALPSCRRGPPACVALATALRAGRAKVACRPEAASSHRAIFITKRNRFSCPPHFYLVDVSMRFTDGPLDFSLACRLFLCFWKNILFHVFFASHSLRYN